MIYETRIKPRRLSLDDLYESTPNKIDIVNMDADMVNILTIKALQNNEVTITPQCLCGSMTGVPYLGELCANCNTYVTDHLGKYKPILWVTHHKKEKKFIAPQFWSMVNNIIKKGVNFDSLAWLSNSNYRSNLMVPAVLTDMVSNIPGFKRTYSYLVDNLEDILIYMSNAGGTMYQKRGRMRDVLRLYREHKDQILSVHMPIPTKELFLMEDTAFSSKKVNLVSGVVKALVLNYKEALELGRDLDRPTSRLISELASTYDMNVEGLLHGKKRIIRSNIFGAKVPGGFRTVMAPISGPHHYEDVILPWIQGVIIFKPYILSRLLSKGYTYIESEIKINNALFKFDQVVSDIVDAIIAEAKEHNGRGVCVAKNRNPTQHRYSVLRLYIVRHKKDPLDYTSESSPMICAALNEDYDGDETNYTLANDLEVEKEFSIFSLHLGAFLPTKPYTISKALSIPDTAIINITSYIMEEDYEETYISPDMLKEIGV